MDNSTAHRKSRVLKIALPIISAILLASLALNAYFLFFRKEQESEVLATDAYTMETGILDRAANMYDGDDFAFTYDFNSADYAVLREKYDIEKIAGEGTEFERAARLMDEFAPRLRHYSMYDNHIEMRALPLLEYSLDKDSHGINCRAKAQILNEMCLALGIYSRKLWINPYSRYDDECHVVNEVWDSSLGKWVMLDITNNEYWVDETGSPLSVLEIRERLAAQELCSPAAPGESVSDVKRLSEKHMGDIIYIAKNMMWFYYCQSYGSFEDDNKALLMPEIWGVGTSGLYVTNPASVNAAPTE